MAVNGIELAVGQVWLTHQGRTEKIEKHMPGGDFPWVMAGGSTYKGDGRWGSERSSRDLNTLLKDQHGFTIWRGGKQPEETKGRTVECRYADVACTRDPADLLCWDHQFHGTDGAILAYKIVDDQPMPIEMVDEGPDANDLAAETLTALGFHFTGQAWVKDEVTELRAEAEYTGGSVNYYQLDITNPTTAGRAPYTVECNDVIEGLGLGFAEGNVLKALWRRAAATKLGLVKRGYTDGLYDAEKVVFFGQRVLAQEKDGAA